MNLTLKWENLSVTVQLFWVNGQCKSSSNIQVYPQTRTWIHVWSYSDSQPKPQSQICWSVPRTQQVSYGGRAFSYVTPYLWNRLQLEFSVPQIEYPLGGNSKKGSHVYFLLQFFWITLLFDINVDLMLPWWPDVTIVVPWQHQQEVNMTTFFATAS